MNVLTVDYTTDDSAQQFTRSLKETGFAVLKNHPIQEALVNKVYAEWADFFANDERFEYPFDPAKQDGYIPMNLSETAKGNDKPDLKEFFHYYAWGRYPKMLSQATRELYASMNKLAGELLDWVEKNSPEEIRSQFSMPLSDMIIDSPNTMYRIINYPAFNGDEPSGAVRAAAHGDINLLTILPAATSSGLQVQDVQGNWHDVPCDHGTLAINTGDMLEMASNHYYPSTTHRVINPEGSAKSEARMSMPLFLHPRDEVRLSNTQTAVQFRHERFREIGLMAAEE